MSTPIPPRRVVLKLSGNSLSGPGEAPFDGEAVDYIAAEVEEAHRLGCQIAAVVGGGNVIRGGRFGAEGHGRILADHAGMLATCINALVLRERLGRLGVRATHFGAFGVPHIVEAFRPEACVEALEAGKVVVLGGGTGNPLFTTDSAAALRAVEIGADLVLKATRVDGVYSADPEVDPGARLFERLTHEEVLERRLGVMDLTAVCFCMVHGLPVRVFNYGVRGNIRRAAAGEPVGTLIGGKERAG